MAIRINYPSRHAAADVQRGGDVRIDKIHLERGTPTPPPITSCRLVTPVTCFTDNFNRVNNPSLGANWQEFFSLVGNTNAFDVNGNELRTSFLPPPPPNVTKGAWWKAFPVGTTHQQSSLTFASSLIVAPPAPTPLEYIINGGGPSVRMIQAGVGTNWNANQKSFYLKYQEHRSNVAPFDRTFAELELGYQQPGGFSVFSTALINPLNPGDVLKITAMSYLFLGAPTTCLKGFVNDVRKIRQDIIDDSGATGIPAGRAGISGTPVGEPFESVAFTINWDNWQGCTAVPV